MLRSLIVRPLQAFLLIALFAFAAEPALAYGPLGGVNLVGGGPNAQNYQLDSPQAIVRVPDGPEYAFFIADINNNRIVKLDADGDFVMSFGGSGGGAGGVSMPRSIAYGSDCDAAPAVDQPCLYVTEAYAVKRFTLSGQPLTGWGGYGSGNGQFDNAYGVAVDPTYGYVAVADSQNWRVQRFTPDGTWVETIGQGGGSGDTTAGHLWGPRGVAFDSNGRLWVADRHRGYINHYARQGAVPFSYSYADRIGGGICSSCSDYMPGVSGLFADITGAGANRIWATTSWDIWADPSSSRFHLFRAAGDASSAPPFTLAGPWGSTGAPSAGPDDIYAPGQPFASGDDLWVPESGNDRIHRYSAALTTPVSAGTWGRSAAQDGYLKNPQRLAAGPDGSVYVWDSWKYRIQHFAPDGSFVNAFGGTVGDDPFVVNQGVGGMAARANGELLVSDIGHSVIKRFSPTGDYLGPIVLPANGCGALAVTPGPLAIDQSGRIYLSDLGNRCVLVLSAAGVTLAQFGQSGSSPNGSDIYQINDIAVDADGTSVFVLDQNRVKEFTSSDGITWTGQTASSGSLGSGTAVGQFSQPQGLDIDPTDGSIYVSDQRNDRVQRAVVAADHSYTWTAFGTRGYGADQFQMPQDLTIDRWGNMWVADLDSDSVKRYGEAPVVTIAPTATTTTDTSVSFNYTLTDPAAECSIATGSVVPLTVGANTISVTCTNAEGSDVKSVTVTRTAPDPPTTPTTPTTPTSRLFLSKKLKLTRSRKVSFKVICPEGCRVSAKLKVGKSSRALKSVALAGRDAAQTVHLKLSIKQYKRAVAALAKRKRVTLTVTVLAGNSKQGKTGSAKLKR